MCQTCVDQSAEPGAGVRFCLCTAPETMAAYRRIEMDLNRRTMIGGLGAVMGMFAGFGLAPRRARAQVQGRPTLLTNLALFDGVTLSMRDGVDILVTDGRITALPPRGQGPQEAEVTDCGGRAVIPGLIDAHWHTTLVAADFLGALTGDIGLVHLMAAHEAGKTLMRGFITVRDVGGPAFALKTAIDRDLVSGPRIFPSGATISQTSGHGDFRFVNTLPRMPGDAADYTEATGVVALADGVDEVLRRTRENLMRGASQIKIAGGGGVASSYDPLDTVQFLESEMRAAVEAAADWGTYVCVHVYNSVSIQRAIRAGIKSIEHGQLADDDTIRMMADTGTWWSIQPFLNDVDANQYADPVKHAKLVQVSEGTINAFAKGREMGVKMAFGTDILFNPTGTASQGRQLAKLTQFMPPLDALHMATGAAGELLALSGDRAPYPGRLGVIAVGALADILVVDGDPATDLGWLDTPDTSLRLIMKGGRVVKDSL